MMIVHHSCSGYFNPDEFKKSWNDFLIPRFVEGQTVIYNKYNKKCKILEGPLKSSNKILSYDNTEVIIDKYYYVLDSGMGWAWDDQLSEFIKDKKMKNNSIEKSLTNYVFKERDRQLLKIANELIKKYSNADDFWDWFFSDPERNDITDFFLWSNILYEVHKYLFQLAPVEAEDDSVIFHLSEMAHAKSVIHVDDIEVKYDIDKDLELAEYFNEYFGSIDETMSSKDILKQYIEKQNVKITPLVEWMLNKMNINLK